MSLRVLIKAMTFVLVLVAVVLFIRETGLEQRYFETWVGRNIQGEGLLGILVFLVAGGFFTAAGFPRQLVCWFGGLLWGVYAGAAMGLLATLMGCAAAFYFSHAMGRRTMEKNFGERLKKLESFLHDNTFAMTLLIRLLPVGSNLVTNFAAGVAGVRLTPFLAASAIGHLPQSVFAALLGAAAVAEDPTTEIIIAVAGFVISGIFGVYLYRKYRHGKSIGGEMAEDIEGS